MQAKDDTEQAPVNELILPVVFIIGLVSLVALASQI
jgi:hypothetical protein